jgi:hypothetical protein
MEEGYPAEDADRLAMKGQLGRCSSGIQAAFQELDEQLKANGNGRLRSSELWRAGEWLARSYKLGRRNILEVHPKHEWIKVRVNGSTAPPIPESLSPPPGEKRSGWLVVNSENRPEAMNYLRESLRAALAR